jgi:Dullard-like phosphatase family protein
VLDLDETLAHSSLLPLSDADLVLSIQVNDVWTKVYVLLRPGLSEFLAYAEQRYEVVFYTASVQAYADQLLDQVDSVGLAVRLYREQCVMSSGSYVKDLKRLGRAMESLILVDVSSQSRTHTKLLSGFQRTHC